ncbi:MAG: hypothetical protein ABSF44_04445 [Candidatus Bathyarchaeia archaeon]|jgi:hypothetical protein
MLFELNGNTANILAYVKNSGLSEEKYLALIPDMKLHQQLFQLKYRENITDPENLRKVLGLDSNIELTKYAEILDAWLASQKTLNLDLVCPECLVAVLTDKVDDGEKVCLCCSLVVGASYDESIPFDDSLDRDVTFQPSSALSPTDGLGCTIKSPEIHKLLSNNDVDFSEFQKTNPQEASELSMAKDGYLRKGGFCYRLKDGYVRRIDLEYTFNQQDLPLRKSKLGRVVDSFANDNKSVLSYSSFICDKYGISDPVFREALARKVRQARATLKYFGNSRPRIRPLVDTVFFRCLLRFKKRTEIQKAKPNLHIDYGIANLIAEDAVFKKKHSTPNLDSSFLDDWEDRVLNNE